MQIIAIGLHRHNISTEIWNRADTDHSQFYDFISSINLKEESAEFLFVNSQF